MTLVDSLGADTYEYPISIHLGQALVSGLRYGILPIRAVSSHSAQNPSVFLDGINIQIRVPSALSALGLLSTVCQGSRRPASLAL